MVYYCFDKITILLVFRIHFQSEACLTKAYFLFRSDRQWIRKLGDLV